MTGSLAALDAGSGRGRIGRVEARISLRQRFLLETWLPREAKLGSVQDDARGLVATVGRVPAAEVGDRLAKVRRHLAELRGPASPLDRPMPVGRGRTFLQPGGA